jgi:hypothetical protein
MILREVLSPLTPAPLPQSTAGEGSRASYRTCLTTFVLLAIASFAPAAEISTNGIGGGKWSEAATWRGNKVPNGDDAVVIQKNDVVTFDRDDDGKVSCKSMQIDPKGVLLFKTNAGKQTCCVAEGIVSFGIIKLDGTRSADDLIELRMVGATPDKRKIKLNKNAALLLYGKANLKDNKRNVALTSPKLPDQKDDILALIETDGFVSIDWQRARFYDVKLQAQKLDNTGAKSNERLNIVGNQFTGRSRLWLHTCDTPVIAKNSFDYTEKAALTESAISMVICPLGEVKNNVVRGAFATGITTSYNGDYIVEGNLVEGAAIGLNSGYGAANSSFRKCIIRNCETGISFEGVSGVIEDTLVEGAMTAFRHENCNLQVTNLQIKGLNAKGTAINFVSGKLSLLNCNIDPKQIKVGPPPATAKDNPITCLQYAIVGVKGAPPGSLVDMRTNDAKLAADATDPNVRNSPAGLVDGHTPLAKALNPLIVRAWTIDLKGKLLPAPEYNVKVLGPAPKEGAARPVLKMMTFRPAESTFRAKLDDPTPTLEVKLP